MTLTLGRSSRIAAVAALGLVLSVTTGVLAGATVFSRTGPFTGCLGHRTGSIYNVAQSATTPLDECASGDHAISLGTAAQLPRGGSSVPNPQQLAILRWYPANQIGSSYPVGSLPVGIAFDGQNLWVANEGADTVTKLRAADGSLVGTYPVGGKPVAIAYDGASVWVADSGSDSVTRLLANDGSLVGSYPAGLAPTALAFDGTNIWLTDGGDGKNPGVVTELRASDGSLVGTTPVGVSPAGIAFDGANLWVVNNGSNDLTELMASDGTVIHAFLTKDEKWRMMTEQNEITSQLKKAILYKEDKFFYYHFGVNPVAIARAAFNNVFHLKRTSGASTITMQVARMLEPKERWNPARQRC